MKKLLLALAVLTPLHADAKPYLNIQEIVTPKGLTVWTVYDESVPVLALKFSIKGGASLDPQDKEGTSNLLTTLFDEGAGDRKAEEFQDALDGYGISMGYGVTRDAFYGSVKTTVQYRNMAFSLMDDALNRPHLEKLAVERMRQAVLMSLRYDEMDPGFIAQKKMYESIFAKDAYARLVDGTRKSVASITREDLDAQRKKLFCRDHLKIAAVGAYTLVELTETVDRTFGDWPACKDKLLPPAKFAMTGGTLHETWNGAQDTVFAVQRGLSRNDKDWWAARILDFALGGGEFSSRLMEEIRVKRGLTYGISTGLIPYDRAPLWIIQSSTAPGKTAQMIDLTKNIWADVAANGLTDVEIAEAKSYLIGSLPLVLTSTDQIAAVLLQLQEDNLPRDTLDRRAVEINAVTAEDIQRVAAQLLKQDELTVVIVGPENKEVKE
jgi:zinc protease